MRTRSEVVRKIASILSCHPEQMGVAVEPIASSSDPDDEVDADYMVRVSFEVHRAGMGDSLFASAFVCYFRMETLRSSSDVRFDQTIASMVYESSTFFKELNAHFAKGDDNVKDAKVVTGNGIKTMGEVLVEEREKHRTKR